MTQQQRDRLNRLGVELSQAQAPEDIARKQALHNEIFLLLDKIAGNLRIKLPNCDNQYVLARDVMGEFYIQDLPKFNASKGDLSSFFEVRIKKRAWKVYNKDAGVYRKKVLNPETGKKETTLQYNASLNAKMDDGETELLDMQADNHGNAAPEKVNAVSTFLEFTALISNLQTRLSGRANNPTKINYFRMFYTDGAVDFMQSCDHISDYVSHERDVLNAMQLPFLDFFMTKACRTVQEIRLTPLKLHGTMVSGQPMRAPKQPLSNDIYCAFMLQQENITVGDSAISNQRKEYKKLLEVCLR